MVESRKNTAWPVIFRIFCHVCKGGDRNKQRMPKVVSPVHPKLSQPSPQIKTEPKRVRL